MFKPNLKRPFNNIKLSQSTNSFLKRDQKQFQRVSYRDRDKSLVPEAFFQECKNIYLTHHTKGLVSPINTCQYDYPKQVINQITDSEPGHFQYNEEIFCFYKQKNIYFWQYQTLSFLAPRKFLKHSFNEVISSVSFKQISHREFQDNNIKIVAVAFGHTVRFYRLSNFQKEKQNCSPCLQNLMLNLYNPDIVTNMSILYEQSPQRDVKKNSLIMLLGDANGNLTVFDFDTKKKFIMDTLKQKLKRNLQKQTYSQVVKILPYKQFVFCLVKRYYSSDSLWKVIQKIIKSPRAEIELQQKLQVYQIQLNTAYNSFYKGPVFPDCKITGVKRYCEYSTKQIVDKIKSSFGIMFEKSIFENFKSQTAYIQSINVKNGYVQIMFQTGQSILADQDLSFAQPPQPCFQVPSTFGVITKKSLDQLEYQQGLQKSVLIRSHGNNLMLFEGFVGAVDKQSIYFSPYSLRNLKMFTRSVQEYKKASKDTLISNNSHFLIFNHKNFCHLEKITPIVAIFLYCTAMQEQFPYKKYIQKQQKLKEKIQKLVEYYGNTQILLNIVQFFMKIKYFNTFRINLRLDLLEMAVRQLSLDVDHTYKQSVRLYEQYDSSLIKNTTFQMTSKIYQHIWDIVFKVESKKVKLIRNTWELQEIQNICIVFQISISQIFKSIRKWTTENFCFNRNEVYKIISYSKILTQVIQAYITKQSQQNSKRIFHPHKNLPLLSSTYFTSTSSQIKSLKINFCILSKQTLQKLILLLKVYDYVGQMKFHGSRIPSFPDLLFNTSKDERIQFAQIIINTLGINNEAILQNLVTVVPQIPIRVVQKFQLWKNLHKTATKDEQNNTFDSSFEEEIQEINQILNKRFYDEIQNYYLTMYITNNGIVKSTKQKSSQFVNGVLLLLRSCLKKILDLRQQQLRVTNACQVYSKGTYNYFGILEIPGLKKQCAQILQDIQFLTICCNKLVDRVFQKYQQNTISLESLHLILDNIRGQLTIQVRKVIQKNIQKHKLSELTKNISRRQLFTTFKPNPPVLPVNNFLSDQMTSNVTKKYR